MAERDRERLERLVGAVLVPQVRVGGTLRSAQPIAPQASYLRRFAPCGVVVFGRTPLGPRSPATLLAAVRESCARAGAPRPFACCDLEQGAGLHLPGATRLPPALALAAAAAGDPRGEEAGLAHIRHAGELTAREARAQGIELVLAPVADANTCRDNPIVAVRSFGDEPASVARRSRAFLAGLHAGGAQGCPKHFPGHGDTRRDSHLELPRVDADAPTLRARELAPFRALLADDPAAVMVAHLDVPALSGEVGTPATLAPRVCTDLLRGELGFAGAALSDAMDMGALEREPRRHVRALLAGCDGLLCPPDPDAAARELLEAVDAGALPLETLARAAARMEVLRARATGPARNPTAPERPRSAGAEAFAAELAQTCLVVAPVPWPWERGAPCELLAPEGGCGPEARAALERLARELAADGPPRGAVLPVVSEVGAWSGSYGVPSEGLERIAARLEALRACGRPGALLWLASPQSLPAAWWSRGHAALLAFAPTPPLVAAAGRWLRGRAAAGGSLPTALG